MRRSPSLLVPSFRHDLLQGDRIACIIIVWILVLLILPTLGYAQSPYVVDLPEILPASPDASNFVKAGVGNANTSSGAATADIPLYTIQVRDFKMPIFTFILNTGIKSR